MEKYKTGVRELEIKEKISKYLHSSKSVSIRNRAQVLIKLRNALLVEQQRREENIRQIRSMLWKKPGE